jgi:hypothetical protein
VAIMVGAAASTLIGAARSITTRAMIASILVAGLAVAAVPVLNDKFGRSFPAAPIAQRAARLGDQRGAEQAQPNVVRAGS